MRKRTLSVCGSWPALLVIYADLTVANLMYAVLRDAGLELPRRPARSAHLGFGRRSLSVDALLMPKPRPDAEADSANGAAALTR